MALVTFDREDISAVSSRFEFEPQVGQTLTVWDGGFLVTATIMSIGHMPTPEGNFDAVVRCRVDQLDIVKRSARHLG